MDVFVIKEELTHVRIIFQFLALSPVLSATSQTFMRSRTRNAPVILFSS